ncbi:YceI family protein [Amphiplicatus metriothermophilus]|uniref:Polyisoprenoid-binding protein YceI n=1 Tax=Amphiplicatus metriothermophilus TaxID=1519374 RepID=A0A239Q038_9PROT|nr:YceI family protein [Amphiplicatus metriothermophilus]MBB5518321.1 polyisoprenoid-binding protein YceI [Amphiplicatus metriothermophilus]SNT75576.1 Polyisoprenoid-binding protein YceI [Amphiplicatus metriothermophilus]
MRDGAPAPPPAAGRRLRLGAPLLAAALALLAGSCASLVKPQVGAEPEALRAGAYRLDPDHAALVFKVGHLGFSRYVGRFERFDAALDFDTDDPAAARVEAVIDIASLDVANDEFAQTLKGARWFDAENHPQAVFRSTKVEITDANAGRVAGTLTLKGVTKPASLDVVFNGGARDMLRGAYVVGFSARGTINRSDFGIDRYGELVGDAVTIEIEAEFLRRGADG